MEVNRLKIFYYLLTVGLIICLGACSGRKWEYENEPNLILITLDTLRSDHLGCYGYGKNTSPVLDELASESIVFFNTISQSAITPVSHASIMTGKNPFNHQLRSLHGGVGFKLPENQVTIAEIMKTNGYRTGAFVSSFTVSKHYGLNQGFSEWDEDFEFKNKNDILTDKGIVNNGKAQRRADETTDKAITWIKDNHQSKFFMWIHYFDVHDPLILPPKEYLNKYVTGSKEKPEILRSVYDAEIAFIDFHLSRLFSELEKLKIKDNTIIAVLSDHGEGLGEHDWWGHCILYQEQIKLIFILSLPDHTKGQSIHPVVRSIDFVPTMVELLKLRVPSDISFDGRSLLDLIKGKEKKPRLAYSESINDLIAYYGSPLRNESLYAISGKRWKLILHREKNKEKGMELFDLEADPDEWNNLVLKKPEIVQQLKNELEKKKAFLSVPNKYQMEEKAKERLKSLGYVK